MHHGGDVQSVQNEQQTDEAEREARGFRPSLRHPSEPAGASEEQGEQSCGNDRWPCTARVLPTVDRRENTIAERATKPCEVQAGQSCKPKTSSSDGGAAPRSIRNQVHESLEDEEATGDGPTDPARSHAMLSRPMLERVSDLPCAVAPVEDALIVAGGLGTRMFPASEMLAKEALPLVDVPVLTHLMHEAVEAGVHRIHLITRPGKDLNAWVEGRGEHAGLRPEVAARHLDPGKDVEVFVHHQVEQRGLGDAIGCALHAVKGPFLVLLGDNLLMNEHVGADHVRPSTASRRLVDAYERTGRPVAALMQVAEADTASFGIVELDGERIVGVVEKPAPGTAPSNLALCGRYLWTEDARDLLNRYDVDTHGELQSIAVQQHWMDGDGLVGVDLEGMQWYDAGRPLAWLQAQVDHALRRDDMRADLEAWLRARLG